MTPNEALILSGLVALAGFFAMTRPHGFVIGILLIVAAVRIYQIGVEPSIPPNPRGAEIYSQ